MFKEKGYIRFRDGEFGTTINYIVKDGKIVGLTPTDSKKIEYLKEHPEIEVADGINSEEFIKATISIDDVNSKDVYDEMEKRGHNHFNSYDEYLAVIEIFPILP